MFLRFLGHSAKLGSSDIAKGGPDGQLSQVPHLGQGGAVQRPSETQGSCIVFGLQELLGALEKHI